MSVEKSVSRFWCVQWNSCVFLCINESRNYPSPCLYLLSTPELNIFLKVEYGVIRVWVRHYVVSRSSCENWQNLCNLKFYVVTYSLCLSIQETNNRLRRVRYIFQISLSVSSVCDERNQRCLGPKSTRSVNWLIAVDQQACNCVVFVCNVRIKYSRTYNLWSSTCSTIFLLIQV